MDGDEFRYPHARIDHCAQTGGQMGVGDQSGDPDIAFQDFDVAAIQVDVDSLKDFRSFLGRELDANLRPGAERVKQEHLMGAGFAHDIVSDSVQAVRAHYGDQLWTAINNLAAYIETSEVFIEAIQRVVARYEVADLRSEEVSKALIEQIAQVTASRQYRTATEHHLGQVDPLLTGQPTATETSA